MYNVQINENGFYMGSYATVGTVKDGVDVTKLPPSENQLCYKLIKVEVTEDKQVPILEYTKYTESETEFDTYYYVKSTDEEGNEVETPITEEEYETLPEDADVSIVQVPKTVTIILSEEEYLALAEEDRNGYIAAYKEDENGELVYETIQVTKLVDEWEFSQERYDELTATQTAQQEASEKLAKALSAEQQRADIDYIALMVGVDLEV